MRKNLVRIVLVAALFGALAVGSLSPAAQAGGPTCEQQCYQDYQRCVPFCSKNPCFVSCETVLEICLSNCSSES